MKALENDRESFWEHAQRALDERRDPRDDPRVLEAILEEPERLRELEILLARIEVLPASARKRPVRRAAVVLAILGAAAALILVCVARKEAPRARAGQSLPEQVVRFEFELTNESPGHSTRIVINDLGSKTVSNFSGDPLTMAILTTELSKPHTPRIP
ncbi:MAG TPA: hypothetical protein VK843_21260 [Planctomycetota bacterium]|nr:hypothetical protein [Planctomycetota bacterium]